MEFAEFIVAPRLFQLTLLLTQYSTHDICTFKQLLRGLDGKFCNGVTKTFSSLSSPSLSCPLTWGPTKF